MTLPWNADIRSRTMRPEMMDRPDLEENAHRAALRGLVRVNIFSLTSRSLWGPIRRLAASQSPRSIRVLDVACGGGDIAIRLARTARRWRLPVEIDGCDISETALAVARERAKSAGLSCQFFQFDVLKDPWPEDYDVVTMSLFLHHLPTDCVADVLRSAALASRKMVLINDLVRNRFGYLLARFGGYVLSRSPIVHLDGPVSVAGAFTLEEVRELALNAGLHGASVRRIWPARLLFEWSRP
jgi:2-polyprenyl-3-methyl-5-hydroxy-6-metoxy-1,4-benzoquinol methylase